MLERSLTRSTPTTALRSFSDPLDRLFERFWSGDIFRPTLLTSGLLSEDVANRTWMPAVDIRETDEAYEVYAELPGMKKDDIGITVENNVLTLSGERRFEKEVNEETFHRIERAYGKFTRSFTLPTQVNPEKVEASYKDGVLTIHIPKVEAARPRKIAIK